jgi:hypothetical protein
VGEGSTGPFPTFWAFGPSYLCFIGRNWATMSHQHELVLVPHPLLKRSSTLYQTRKCGHRNFTDELQRFKLWTVPKIHDSRVSSFFFFSFFFLHRAHTVNPHPSAVCLLNLDALQRCIAGSFVDVDSPLQRNAVCWRKEGIGTRRAPPAPDPGLQKSKRFWLVIQPGPDLTRPI